MKQSIQNSLHLTGLYFLMVLCSQGVLAMQHIMVICNHIFFLLIASATLLTSASFPVVTESLVHPAMFAHTCPKRVAIVGGGEGATLREVLKHKTVEKVVMIDIDEQMVLLSRKFLPFWSDCSIIEKSSKSCFDDPRVDTYFEDAFQWFMKRFSVAQNRGQPEEEEPFDVIILDAL
jgi:spermidine synthase